MNYLIRIIEILFCGLTVDTIYYYLEKQYYNKALEICNEIVGTKGVLVSYRIENVVESGYRFQIA